MNNQSFYIIAVFLLMLVLTGPGIVSAYSLSLDAPTEVQVGQPIQITGTTNIPPPDKIDIILSHSINIPVEMARQSIDITEKGDNSFNVTFETSGYDKGNYKVEALSQTQRDFSAGSKNLRVVKLTDRSDIIRFSSPSYQDFGETLLIEARIQGYEDKAIQMEVKLGNESLFGPESIPVNRGLIKYELPITRQGAYTIIFHDYKGYIGTYTVQVGEGETVAPTAIATEKPTEKPTVQGTVAPVADTPTVEKTPEPTVSPVITQSTSAVTTTPTTVATTQSVSPAGSTGPGVSGTAKVSRDAPAYFLVTVKQTPVTISTSAEDDWVLEYKVKPDAAVVKVNDKMKNEAETATISDNTKEVYLKVYPYSYKSAGEVTITANNAESVALSDAAAKAFGAPPRYGNSQATGTSKSPAPVAGMILGLICAVWLIRKN